MSRADTLESIFPGNSEMARLMRTFDWSTSEAGDPEKWPESLKAAVRICVGSRNPIVIWWGKTALSQIYNDGYMRILTAAKHPQWLGRCGAECWSEIMETMGPLWQQVMATGEATWFEDFLYIMNRNLPREECYFTFSYSALRNDSGIVDGILCICYETSSRVIGDGRLRTVRDLGRTLAAAKTPEDACQFAAEVLVANPQDIPFSLLYLVEDEGTHARLIASSGFGNTIEPGPERIDLTSAREVSGWPLKRVLDKGSAEEISGLSSRFERLPGGSWPESPEKALIVPISAAGQFRGFLVAGLSTRRIVDADYRSFFDLVAGHISTAIANATAYEQERKRAEALAELDRAKTTFFANVSHEFRTPLTLMLGPLEDELRENPHASERLKIAHRNSLRLLKLVNTLLDFARIEAGRAKALYEPTELSSMTGDLASHFRSAIERAGVQFTVDCLPLEQPVYVDREMWEKIVLNLLSNAFKFTFEGTISVRLQAVDKSQVLLTISDTGIGISESELPHVFERFHRASASRGRSFEGTGIGLALVQELVQLHGGTITVESTNGKGSTFKVTVPFGKDHLTAEQIGGSRELASTATRAEAFVEEALRWLPEDKSYEQKTPANLASSEARAERKSVDDQTERVLVVDDNADMRDHLRRLLSEQYQVSAAANGEEAFQLALIQTPDVVLADVMMPKLDGFGLLRQLKSDKRTRRVPVILLSARAGEEARAEGIEAGADDYLVKPFSARELRSRIAAHAKQAHIRKAEADLRESLERYRQLFERATDAIWIADQEGRFIRVNPAGLEMLGYSPQEHLRLSMSDIIRPQFLPQLAEVKHELAAGNPMITIWEVCRADGTNIVVEFSHAFTPDGLWQAIGRDITERERQRTEQARRAVEQQYRAHLEQEVASRTSELEVRVAERDALLKEVHHRVKNNLHVISSMLEMQARRTDDFVAFQQLEEACHRVTSIAQIHELLYQSGSFSSVDLAAYADRIARQLVALYNVQDRIEVEVEGGPVNIDLERAVPCGLLLSELVSNTCKHAFPESSRGRLIMGLTEEDEQIRLTVRDTGVGLPSGFDVSHSDSLGLTIVRLLADQLRASMSVRNGGGTCVEVQFAAAK